MFDSDEVNAIYWLASTDVGLCAGTLGGEWIISATTLNAPLTPSDIQAHVRTHIQCANIVPIRTALTTVFVQARQRELLELFPDVFSGKIVTPSLSIFAKHLATQQIKELAYQQEITPIIWARRGDGYLLGDVYRRSTAFSNQEPDFNGWFQIQLGSGRFINYMAVGSNNDGTLDALSIVTSIAGEASYVEVMAKEIEAYDTLSADTTLLDSCYVDMGIIPTGVQQVGQNLVLTGLWPHNGHTVSVWMAGLDRGDFAVANGQCTVPLSGGSSDPLTPAFLTSMAGLGNPTYQAPFYLTGGTIQVNCVVGFTYTSQGQIPRAVAPAESGAQVGPALGKTRRTHLFAMYMPIAGSVSGCVNVGTDFSNLTPAAMLQVNNQPFAAGVPFKGVLRGSLKDTHSFDSQFCWQVTRPYPLTVGAVAQFLETSDQ